MAILGEKCHPQTKFLMVGQIVKKDTFSMSKRKEFVRKERVMSSRGKSN